MFDDRQLLGLGRVVDADHEHEAVELRLGQRIRPLLLDRVLRGEHEEGLRQRVAVAADGDLLLLHRFEEGCLGLRRRAVDLVGQHDVGKHRAGQEPELAGAGCLILLDHLGARDVGRHQVRRELHAAELEAERVGQRADEQRLRQARHAFQDAVTPGEQGDEQLLDHVLLADNHLAKLSGEPAVRVAEALDRFKVRIGKRHGGGVRD